jgi:hypothetical protein
MYNALYSWIKYRRNKNAKEYAGYIDVGLFMD